MRRTVHISGQIEPFFGTLDENVRVLEDALRVRTHLHDTRLTIEGEQDSVDQAVKIVEEYNRLTRHGRTLSAAEVKSLMRVATEEQIGRASCREGVQGCALPIYPFLGALEERVGVHEDGRRVRTHRHDARLTIEGGRDGAARAEKFVKE